MKKLKASSVIVTLLLIALCAVAVTAILRVPESNPLPETETAAALPSDTTAAAEPTSAPVSDEEIKSLVAELKAADDSFVTQTLEYCGNTYGAEVLSTVLAAVEDKSYEEELWYNLTGNTLTVLGDLASGAAKTDKHIVFIGNTDDGVTDLTFVGDINLADNWSLMQHYNEVGALSKCVSPELIDIMNKADIAFANNEFTFSSRGEAQSGKSYTFRADPKNVSLLGELGIDIVSVANNHIYDYGAEAFADTLTTLEGAGIAHVGAGSNLAEASQAQYYIVNGRKIAFVSAGESYSWYRTPAAKENSEGILPVETQTQAVAAVKAAAELSDIVIVYAHWGFENQNWYSDEQLALGKAFVDAGANAVIGSHPHVLQGMEFYNDSLLAFSLGNFWFNTKTMNSGLLRLTVGADGKITPVFFPCVQSEGNVTLKTDAAEAEKIFYFVEGLSRNWCIDIKDDGTITKAK